MELIRQSPPLIELKNAGVQRDGRWLVRGVSMSLAPREIITLIGPNGSGKSTTAKIALGLMKPNEGSAKRANALNVGYVPQSLTIDQTMPLSVSRFMRLTKRLSSGDINNALSRAGVDHLAKADIQSLSGGEFQRVMLARALAQNPNVLVLDEPVQNVDMAGQVALYKLIADVRDELGCAILMISHDLHIVMAATDRVICLNGHVCCEGTPTAVSEDPVYRRLFSGRNAAELAVYAHEHDHTHLPDGRVRHADGSITDDCGHAHDDHRKERADAG